MARLNALAVALACAALFGAASADSSSASGSSSPFADIPLCSQLELVDVSETMTTNARKLQCQSILGVTEMVTVDDPLSLCDVPSCVAALQVLYSTLPKCRYQDWPIQYECEMLLKNCGITPVNVTESSDAGSLYFGSASTTDDAGDAGAGDNSPTTWNVSSSDSSSEFAPVGVTPSPSTAAPTPTPTPTNSASTVAASVALAVIAASAVASAL